MRKSFKPQFRSKLKINYPVLHLLFIFTIIFCTPFALKDGSAKILVPGIIIIYIIILICNKIIEKEILSKWDNGGYEKIEIDTDKKLIIFDNLVKIASTDIQDASLQVINNPTSLVWITRRYDAIFNSKLTLHLKSGENIDFFIHYRKDAIKILELLKACNINSSTSENINRNFGILYSPKLYIFFIICFLIIILFGIFHH